MIVTCLLGCDIASEPAPRVTFPTRAIIVKLAISVDDRSSTIDDSIKIDAFMAELSKPKGAWHHVPDTYPGPQAMVTLVNASNEQLCRVDIGLNWLGSTCGQTDHSKWPPLVTMSPGQARYFRDAVGGNWEIK